MNRLLVVVMLVACSRSEPTVVSSRAPAAAPEPAKPSKAELCERLLVHLVDLEFARAGNASADQKRAVVEARSMEFDTVCKDKTAREKIECALAAKDLDAVGRCDHGRNDTERSDNERNDN